MLNWFALFIFGSSLTLERLVFLVLAFLLTALLVFFAPRLRVIAWLFPGSLILVALFMATSLYPQGQPTWMPMWVFWTWDLLPTALPALAVIFSAVLAYSVLRSSRRDPDAESVGTRASAASRPATARWSALALLLALLLILKTFHSLYWVTVWDDTSDSIGYAWAFLPVLGSLYAGILIYSFLPDLGKRIGLFYLLPLPILLVVDSALAQRVDYRQLTTQRAARVDHAIQAYYASHGSYPQNLSQLVPRYLLSVSGPVIIIGQDWCYQGRQDAYQFGYVTHQNWWTPIVSAALVASHGDASAFGPICAAEIRAINAGGP